MELTVHGPLRGVTGSKTVSIATDNHGQTVQRVLEQFVAEYPRADTQLFTDDGTLRASVRVVVDGERADPETECSPTADITLIPAAQGG